MRHAPRDQENEPHVNNSENERTEDSTAKSCQDPAAMESSTLLDNPNLSWTFFQRVALSSGVAGEMFHQLVAFTALSWAPLPIFGDAADNLRNRVFPSATIFAVFIFVVLLCLQLSGKIWLDVTLLLVFLALWLLVVFLQNFGYLKKQEAPSVVDPNLDRANACEINPKGPSPQAVEEVAHATAGDADTAVEMTTSTTTIISTHELSTPTLQMKIDSVDSQRECEAELLPVAAAHTIISPVSMAQVVELNWLGDEFARDVSRYFSEAAADALHVPIKDRANLGSCTSDEKESDQELLRAVSWSPLLAQSGGVTDHVGEFDFLRALCESDNVFLPRTHSPRSEVIVSTRRDLGVSTDSFLHELTVSNIQASENTCKVHNALVKICELLAAQQCCDAVEVWQNDVLATCFLVSTLPSYDPAIEVVRLLKAALIQPSHIHAVSEALVAVHLDPLQRSFPELSTASGLYEKLQRVFIIISLLVCHNESSASDMVMFTHAVLKPLAHRGLSALTESAVVTLSRMCSIFGHRTLATATDGLMMEAYARSGDVGKLRMLLLTINFSDSNSAGGSWPHVPYCSWATVAITLIEAQQFDVALPCLACLLHGPLNLPADQQAIARRALGLFVTRAIVENPSSAAAITWLLALLSRCEIAVSRHHGRASSETRGCRCIRIPVSSILSIVDFVQFICHNSVSNDSFGTAKSLFTLLQKVETTFEHVLPVVWPQRVRVIIANCKTAIRTPNFSAKWNYPRAEDNFVLTSRSRTDMSCNGSDMGANVINEIPNISVEGWSDMDLLTIEECNAKLDNYAGGNVEFDAVQRFFREMRRYEKADFASFGILLRLYCKSNPPRTKAARSLLDEMIDIGMNPDENLFTWVVSAALTTKDSRLAMNTIDLMISLNMIPTRRILHDLFKNLRASSPDEDKKRSLELIDSTNIFCDLSLFSAAVESLARLKDFRRLEVIVQNYRESILFPNVQAYGILIKAFGRCQEVAIAASLWNEMTRGMNLTPNSFAYGCILDTLVSNDRVEEAFELFEQSIQANIIPSTVQYSIMIKGCASRKQIDRALFLFRDMQRRGIKFNEVAFNTLINAFVSVHDLPRALALQKEMWEIGGLTPDLVTYSIMIKGFCEQGSMPEALSLFSDMKKAGVIADVVVYNTLLEALAKSQDESLIDFLVEEMDANGVAPSQYTLTILIKFYGICKRLDKALKLMNGWPNFYGFEPDSYVFTALIAACANNNRLDLSLAYFRELLGKPNFPVTPRTYGTVIAACLREGQTGQAVDIADVAGCNGVGLDPVRVHQRIAETLENMNEDETKAFGGISVVNNHIRRQRQLSRPQPKFDFHRENRFRTRDNINARFQHPALV